MSLYKKPVNSYDDIIELWKSYWDESQLSESILKKLKDKSVSLIERLKPKEGKQRYKPWENPDRVEMIASLSHMDDTTRIINHGYAIEEKRKFEHLKTDFNSKLTEIKYLEKQIDRDSKELHSITYPKHWRFGYSSFLIFAVLGVIVPVTSQWWYFYTKEYTDLFAIISFSIGLGITFAYIGKEIYSIFHASKNI